MEIKMIVDNKIYQALVIKELKHEARLSDRQIRVCEWSQFKDGKIKTWAMSCILPSPPYQYLGAGCSKFLALP